MRRGTAVVVPSDCWLAHGPEGHQRECYSSGTARRFWPVTALAQHPVRSPAAPRAAALCPPQRALLWERTSISSHSAMMRYHGSRRYCAKASGERRDAPLLGAQ